MFTRPATVRCPLRAVSRVAPNPKACRVPLTPSVDRAAWRDVDLGCSDESWPSFVAVVMVSETIRVENCDTVSCAVEDVQSTWSRTVQLLLGRTLSFVQPKCS